jgi:hypothetical protein
MIYEVRTYTMSIGDAEEAIEDFGSIIEKRQKLSTLIGFFQCAIGEMNRIMHIWEYESSAHRESVRAETLRQSWWPPLKAEKILKQVTRLMAPAPFRLKPMTGNLGTVYEIRSDIIQTGKMDNLSDAWAEALPERERLSPLAAAFANPAGQFESGILNEFLHIWPYRDMSHWADVRSAADQLTNWQKSSSCYLAGMKSELWYPVRYSPMH